MQSTKAMVLCCRFLWRDEVAGIAPPEALQPRSRTKPDMGNGCAASNSAQRPPTQADRGTGQIHSRWRQIGNGLRAHPYLLGLTAVVLAIGLRFLIDPWLGDQMPYITFILAVAVTGLYGGVGPALVTTFMGAAVAYWCFVPPRYQWGFQGISDAVGFGIYLAVAIAIVLLTRARNQAANAAERSFEQQIETARQLLDAEALFKAFMENSPGCAYLRDERGEHVYMNATARQVLGVSEEVAGNTNLGRFPTPTAQAMRDQDEEVLRSGRAKQFVDKIVDPDGERYWLTVKFPFVDQRECRFVGGTSFEITDRIRAEEVLRQAERLAAAEQMASLLAHEINNPLAALTNVMFLLEREPLPPASANYASMASRELQRINRIAGLTMVFYRESETPTRIDICKIMDEVVEGLLAMPAFCNVEVIRDFRCSTSLVGSVLKIRQLLANLLVNAFESGTKVVRIRVRSGYDRRSPARAGIRITIADAGRGIGPTDRQHVFEPFFSTKTSKASGLGLWASKLIVLRKDGSIRLRSATTGRTGTCVTVFLLLESAAQLRVASAPAARIA
jgi:PAS domain S-box-containing protein